MKEATVKTKTINISLVVTLFSLPHVNDPKRRAGPYVTRRSACLFSVGRPWQARGVYLWSCISKVARSLNHPQRAAGSGPKRRYLCQQNIDVFCCEECHLILFEGRPSQRSMVCDVNPADQLCSGVSFKFQWQPYHSSDMPSFHSLAYQNCIWD
jgi:hypothetical protein